MSVSFSPSSISNSMTMSNSGGKCSGATNQGNIQGNIQSYNLPQSPLGIPSKNNTKISNTFNLNDLTDDYHKQFYLSPY